MWQRDWTPPSSVKQGHLCPESLTQSGGKEERGIARVQTLKPDSGGSSSGSVPLCGLGLNESVSLCLPFLSITEVNNSNCLTGLL